MVIANMAAAAQARTGAMPRRRTVYYDMQEVELNHTSRLTNSHYRYSTTCTNVPAHFIGHKGRKMATPLTAMRLRDWDSAWT